jgi:vancomycin resistance protein YoaR
MNRFKFFSLVFLLLASSAGLLYYIVVNTVFAERILPSVSIAGKQISFANQDELNYFSSTFSDNSQKPLEVYFDDIKFEVPINELKVRISQHEATNYGKGSDITKVITEGLALLGGKEIVLDIFFDSNVIINYFPFKIEPSDKSAFIDGFAIKNCDSNKYNLSINETALYEYAKKALLFDTPLKVSLEEILNNPSQRDIIKACTEYRAQLQNLSQKLPDESEFQNIKNSLIFLKTNYGYGFNILDFDNLEKSFQSIKLKADKPALDGNYVIKGNKAYFYEKYQTGKSLDIEKSLSNLSYWFTIKNIDILSYDEVIPNILKNNYEIIDVSKLLAQGKTRIDIIRDGKYNWGMVNAEYGLKAIDNYVIAPKNEFAFITDSGASNHAYPIGGGICNATTTMFRTALEAGFEITERHQHSSNVESYAWGYPENLVDAAFLTDSPKLDLKFINDLDFPVLLKLEITRDDNNYQYHTVNVYTSPQAPERKVEIFDFKKWNIRSSKVFDGSFTRNVYQDGTLIRTDTFESKYR